MYLDDTFPALGSLELGSQEGYQPWPGAISKAYVHHHLEKKNEPYRIEANSGTPTL